MTKFIFVGNLKFLAFDRSFCTGEYKRMAPYGIKTRAFFLFFHTLWDIITPSKPILVEVKLQIVDLDEIYTQKVRGKVVQN